MKFHIRNYTCLSACIYFVNTATVFNIHIIIYLFEYFFSSSGFYFYCFYSYNPSHLPASFPLLYFWTSVSWVNDNQGEDCYNDSTERQINFAVVLLHDNRKMVCASTIWEAMLKDAIKWLCLKEWRQISRTLLVAVIWMKLWNDKTTPKLNQVDAKRI